MIMKYQRNQEEDFLLKFIKSKKKEISLNLEQLKKLLLYKIIKITEKNIRPMKNFDAIKNIMLRDERNKGKIRHIVLSN